MSPGGVFLTDSLEDSVRGLLAQLPGGLQEALGCQEDGGNSTEPLGNRQGRVRGYGGHRSSVLAAEDRPTERCQRHDTHERCIDVT